MLWYQIEYIPILEEKVVEELERDKHQLLAILRNAYTNGNNGANLETILKDMQKQLPTILQSKNR